MASLHPLTVVLPEGEALEQVEAKMLAGIQPVTFLKHHFDDHSYVREIWMPAGAIILGHRHKTAHLNIVVCGKAIVRAAGTTMVIGAGPLPYTFRSAAGVRKALYIIEDMTWMTVHRNPTNERDIPTLEAMLTEKSDTFQQHEIEEAQRAFRDVLAR